MFYVLYHIVFQCSIVSALELTFGHLYYVAYPEIINKIIIIKPVFCTLFFFFLLSDKINSE